MHSNTTLSLPGNPHSSTCTEIIRKLPPLHHNRLPPFTAASQRHRIVSRQARRKIIATLIFAAALAEVCHQQESLCDSDCVSVIRDVKEKVKHQVSAEYNCRHCTYGMR